MNLVWEKQKAFTIVELLIVIVVIAILAAITIVAYTGVTQRAKNSAQASLLSQWRTKAALYRVDNGINDCPTGYAFVYGNASLGTMPGFCVMKYEAKNVSGSAVSQASGLPWVGISQVDAIAQSTSVGGHLITEAEWMTIAADVVSVDYNWSGGSINSGVLYQGHVNNNPTVALAASEDDTDSLNGITGGTDIMPGGNSSRVLYLSSGDAIWDFSGNVWEWTQQAVGVPTLVVSSIGVPGEATATWRSYTYGSLSLGNLASVSKPTTLNSYVNPVTGASLSGVAWSAGKGVGQILANYADSSERAFRRGGAWGDGSNSGVLGLSTTASATATFTYVGFRVVR
ncbi:prepilin-type N-terminal cleavage/methylation domain-containing protein [Candidatus Saccharibacteria bacterium]|nr:prepilin-type N-terminal cleavage/methylation domain-containing protein [Candidatus Saccharibacteria bacterium]